MRRSDAVAGQTYLAVTNARERTGLVQSVTDEPTARGAARAVVDRLESMPAGSGGFVCEARKFTGDAPRFGMKCGSFTRLTSGSVIPVDRGGARLLEPETVR